MGLVPVTVSESRLGVAAAEALRADVRITALEAIPFAVPYRRPAAFASGTVTMADNVVVRVHTDVVENRQLLTPTYGVVICAEHRVCSVVWAVASRCVRP